jgi:hypothetical protein
MKQEQVAGRASVSSVKHVVAALQIILIFLGVSFGYNFSLILLG